MVYQNIWVLLNFAGEIEITIFIGKLAFDFEKFRKAFLIVVFSGLGCYCCCSDWNSLQLTLASCESLTGYKSGSVLEISVLFQKFIF